MTKSPAKKTKCGFVAIVGSPNAGKSTLLNILVGQKLSIVTPKPQTTRNRVRGIKIHNDTQIVFVDTPGIFKIKGKLDNRLNRSIVETSKNSFDGVDYFAFIFDCSKEFNENDEEVLKTLESQKSPKILILNKVDIIRDKAKLLDITTLLNSKLEFEKTFMISALKNKGTEDFIEYISKHLPDGVFLYPKDEISDFPMRIMAAEITREKIFLNIQEEIPYSIFVETEKFEEKKDSIKINQIIYTVTESHKKIILGKGASVLKRIGEQSRRELTQLTGKKVSVFLHVKVSKDWMEKKESYLTSGIDFSTK